MNLSSFYSQYDHEKSFADVNMYQRTITPPNNNNNHGLDMKRSDPYFNGYRESSAFRGNTSMSMPHSFIPSGPSNYHQSVPSPSPPQTVFHINHQANNPSVAHQRPGSSLQRGPSPGHSVHKGNDSMTLNCHYCGGLFGTRTELRSHLFNYCTKRQFILSNGSCRECSGTFPEFVVYTSHIEVCRRSKRPDKSKTLSVVVDNEQIYFNSRSIDTTDSEASAYTLRTSPSLSSSTNTSPISVEGTLNFGGYINPDTLVSASAWWIADASETIITQGSAPISLDSKSSIYRVDYEGLLQGLLSAIQYNVKKLVIRGSSDIVSQFSNLEEIAFLRSIQTSEKEVIDYILRLLPKFQRIEFVKIPVERNHYVRMVAEDAAWKFQRHDLPMSAPLSVHKMPTTGTGAMSTFSSLNHFSSEGMSRLGPGPGHSLNSLSHSSTFTPSVPPGLFSSNTNMSWNESESNDVLSRRLMQERSMNMPMESLRGQLNPLSDPIVEMSEPKLPDWLSRSYANGPGL